jgi:hypothetical protein
MAELLEEGLSFAGLTHRNLESVIGVAAEERSPPFLLYTDDGQTNLKRFSLIFKGFAVQL